MPNNLLYQISLTLIPNIGAVHAKILLEHFGNAENIFKASIKKLSAVENIGEVKARCIKSFEDFSRQKKK